MSGQFVSIDYEMLERDALAGATFPPMMSGRMSSKVPNFGNIPTEWECQKCGHRSSILSRGHSDRDCAYRRARQEMYAEGFVPVPPLAGGVLRAAEVPIKQGAFKKRSEKRSWSRKKLQRSDYAPVWAVLVYNAARLGSLTSTKRPQVRAAISAIQRVKDSPEDQKLFAGEHILEGGPYTSACQALVGRLSR